MTRNTPTHVGKTVKNVLAPALAAETPPRTWGRPAGVSPDSRAFGNTPTHVGKTSRYTRRHHRFQKHPHARGEDTRKPDVAAYAGETPPRTWGRRQKKLREINKKRNTPTHVGKTLTL